MNTIRMNTEKINADQIIQQLGLEPLAHEGGYFKRTVTLSEGVDHETPSFTSIYYLLKNDEFSAFHKIVSDEIFYHHAGEPFEMFLIDRSGQLIRKILGTPDGEGEFFVHVPAHTWQASRLLNLGSVSKLNRWGLVSTAVVPGFQWKDFQLGGRKELSQIFPQHQILISELTRD